MKSKASLDLEQLPIEGIAWVAFFKRDELTTDLICCEVATKAPTEQVFFFHEEMDGWNQLLAHLGQLKGFRSDWYEAVALPTFAESRTVAYRAQS